MRPHVSVQIVGSVGAELLATFAARDCRVAVSVSVAGKVFEEQEALGAEVADVLAAVRRGLVTEMMAATLSVRSR